MYGTILIIFSKNNMKCNHDSIAIGNLFHKASSLISELCSSKFTSKYMKARDARNKHTTSFSNDDDGDGYDNYGVIRSFLINLV